MPPLMSLLSRSIGRTRRAHLVPPAPAFLDSIEEPSGLRPLRIALVTEYYYPHLGGVCEHVHFFAQEARRRGHHVDIITSRIGGALPSPHVIRIGRSVPVYANGSQARVTIGFGLRRQMRKVLRRGQYDIVHVHSPLTPFLPLLAIEEAECPVVGTFHTYFDHSRGYDWLNGFFQRRLDKLASAIAVSRSTTVALERYFRADWKIIPNGIDTDLFSPNVPVPKELQGDVPAILFLGRFDPRNGLTTLIDAFRRVRARGTMAKLVVVGDGPLRDHYRRLAAGDPDIVFVGSVLRERPQYYAHSAIYACPTTKASFGITLLEAMACETPIVCSDIMGFRDVVEDGREAMMVPCGDPQALADALVHLLEDPALRRRLGATGRERAMGYSWSSVTTAVLGEYARVLGLVMAAASAAANA
jgi:phosphatidyl-myo-inositol alpha-mannosyltransferase